MKRVLISIFAVVAIFALSMQLTQTSSASSTGIIGFSGNPDGSGGASCVICHSGGVLPTIALDAPTSAYIGSTYTFEVSIQSNDALQTHAGLNVSVTDGTFDGAGASDLQVVNNEVTHTSPKMNDGTGMATFAFDWTAPTTPGTHTVYLAANSVNLNGVPSGDAPDTLELQIEVTEKPTDVSLSDIAGIANLSAAWLVPLSSSIVLFGAALFVQRRQ